MYIYIWDVLGPSSAGHSTTVASSSARKAQRQSIGMCIASDTCDRHREGARRGACWVGMAPLISHDHGKFGIFGDDTLWLFNIAMEIDGLPIKNGDFPWLC